MILTLDEEKQGVHRLEEDSWSFSTFIRENQLLDLEPMDGTTTWRN